MFLTISDQLASFWTFSEKKMIFRLNHAKCLLAKVQSAKFQALSAIFQKGTKLTGYGPKWSTTILYSIINSYYLTKGRARLPKRMNFWKNSKRPLNPPPSFLENYIAIFFIIDMVAYMQGGMRARQYGMHAHDFQRQV